MPRLNHFLNEVTDDILELAKKKLGGHLKETKEDARMFMEKTQADFNRWLKLVESRDLTQEDFKWLALGKKDLLELYALKHAGVSLIEAEKFKDDLLHLIINGALELLKDN